MQTIEVSFTNRHKEKITADAVSFTEAPGWIIMKTGGVVVEVIPAGVIERLKFLPTTVPMELAAPVPLEIGMAALQARVLSLPNRRETMEQRRHFSPLVSQRH